MRSKHLMLLLVAFFAFSAAPALAQFKASIQGTVLDPKGGVVAGAKVTVTNPATGIVYEAVASGVGYYRVSELPPGNYSVTVEAPGFKKFVSEDVAVQAEQPRGLDVTLNVGVVSEQVTVIASQQVLQTEDPNISSTISSDQIERLPQVGRDPYELLKLAPGVFADGSRTADGLAANLPNSGGPGGSNTSIFLLENQVQATANGQRNSANNFTIDGTSVNSLTWGGAAVVTPNQESVQDITVLANTYSAEDGRNSGAQIKVVSKSGTNQFHGSGFFKLDNPGFNAFARWGGPDGQAPRKNETNLRQFGGSIGGPILKEKLFFFFSYEGDRTASTNFSGSQYVETPALAQWITANRAGTPVGDLLAAKGSAPRIAQVLTATCADMGSVGLGSATNCAEVAGGVDIGSPQKGGCTLTYGQYQNIFGGTIPPPAGSPPGTMGTPIDPTTFNGCGLDGIADLEKVIIAVPTHSSGNQYNARVDYNLTKSDLIAVSFYITPINSVGGDLGADGRPMADLSFDPRNRYVALIWNRVISSTMTNEARMNFTRLTVNQFASNSGTAWNLPRFEIEDMPFARIKYGANQGTNSPAILAQNQYIYSDTLSKIAGRHGLKFGVSLAFNQDNNDYEFGAARPVYVAHGLWNFVNGTPIYEGINVDPRTGLPTDVHKYYRQHDVGFFVQDDFKVRPNLTLNIGLRYDYFAPLNERFGRQSNLILGPGSDPLATASLRQGEQLYPADKNNFAPRLGFAWTPSEFVTKTVVRGGFGVAYNRIADTVSAITRVNPPFLFREGACCAMSDQDFAANPWGQPPFFPNAQGNNLIVVTEGQSNNPLSWPANLGIAQTFDPSTGLPLSGTVEVWGASQRLRTPYTYLYSLDVQHELPGNFIFDAGYQGSESRKLERIVGLNRVFSNTGVLNPAYFLVGDVNANFNALNISATRRYTRGFQFAGKYQFSRGFDQGSWDGAGGARDPYYPANKTWDTGPSDFVVTHNVLISGLYDLPIFKSRHDFVGKAFGGWSVDGTFQFHSGFPWSPVESNNCPPTPSAGGLCPALVASYLGGAKNDFSTDTFKSNHGQFPGIATGGTCPDTSKGETFGPGDVGFPYFNGCTVGPPFLHRNAFRGPRYQTIDASFAKSTPVPFFRNESANLDLRVNFFNLFNKLNLAPFGKNDGSTSLNNPHFGVAQNVLAGRVMEVQARLTF